MLRGYPKKVWNVKCSGGFAQAYKGGGRYWYYIELKHPGFISSLFKDPNNGNKDIKTVVQEITGESLGAMCKECEENGFPYDIH